MNATLLLCGMGTRLGHMTMETDRALRRCERIVCVGLPEEVFREVRGRFKQAEPLARGRGDSLDAALRERVRVLLAGRSPRAGVLFLGHPLVYSAAPALLKLCRRLRRSYRVFAGVSMSDVALAAAEPALSSRRLDSFGTGLIVHSAPELLRTRTALDARFSTVILNLFQLRQDVSGRPRAWRRLTDYLERFYGPGHPAILLKAGHGGAPDEILPLSVRTLREIRTPIDSQTTLFLPMRRK